MNRKDIIRMAREADDYADKHTPGFSTLPNEWQEIRDKRFAALVAAEATEEANRRANASWTLMCKKMVAAECEAWRKEREQLLTQIGVLRSQLLGMRMQFGEGSTISNLAAALAAEDAVIAAAIRARGQA